MRISDWSSDVCSSDLEEDPEDKVVIVTAEDEGHPDGFWPGEKDEQSRAYAKRATGNYLWQIDVDEFYRSEDIEAVIEIGRATCRERVCKYVYIPVGAVSLKKK